MGSMQTNGDAIRIRLGRPCIELRSSDGAFLARSRQAYGPFLTDAKPDFCIDLSLEGERSVAEINALLPELHAIVQGDCFSTQPPLLEGQVDWAHNMLRVRTQRHMVSPGVEYRLLNFLLRAVYYAVYRSCWSQVPDAYLVHGCGILAGGRAYLFTGPSGVGKTTIARLAGGKFEVLNDEVVLLGRDGAAFSLAGTPFDGSISARSSACGDLAGVFFLQHDHEVRRRKLGQARAYLGLLAQTLEASAFEPTGTARLEERADFCAAVAANVPCFELGFRPDASVWDVLEVDES